VGLRKCCFLKKTGIIEKNFSKSIQVPSILTAGFALGEYHSSPLHYPLDF
jgi:hypothetical protein